MLKSNPMITEDELQEGVYISQYSFQLHKCHNSNLYINDPDFRPNDAAWYYGVCDGIENLIDVIPELLSPDREFLVLLTEITKHDQPRDYGWRWHKWGDYIGTQTPTTEYIANEPEIDLVYCYHIYEKKQ
jgi:hypothetical protein